MNRVELIWIDECWRDFEDMCGPPGTGLIRPPPGWRPPSPPRPPPRPPSCRPPWRPHYQFDDDSFQEDFDEFDDEPQSEPSAAPEAYHHGPPGPGHNREQRLELVRPHSTGVIFADGYSVRLLGAGEAKLIRVF